MISCPVPRPPGGCRQIPWQGFLEIIYWWPYALPGVTKVPIKQGFVPTILVSLASVRVLVTLAKP